ncbi:PGG domain-containing protein [Artemisia annua]|uniref:PGG domain-containing protein n=1 Tax=Artemisia annua TaxID=35608 RepID=A0A2U1Q7V7_ARTAN|nr:PGG domain-containing protein [Artemisia annua]
MSKPVFSFSLLLSLLGIWMMQVIEIIRDYPDLARVYNLLMNDVTDNNHQLKTVVDKNENDLLHYAGRMTPMHKLNLVTDAALYKCNRSFSGLRREHMELRKQGKEWIKKAADSYTITAALIVTIVIAGAIPVPGGNDGQTGKPLYVTEPRFIIFSVADAISLFTSTTALLLFLSILTARYRDKDFLYRLPKILILGLSMLFLSMTSMMGEAWILIPIAILACIPIFSFVTLQLSLLADLILSTYFPRIFHKKNDTIE